MVDSNHCSQCNALLTEIDFYGASSAIVGPGMAGFFMHLPEEDLEALRGRLNESQQTPQDQSG
jgi:hypothetical protein